MNNASLKDPNIHNILAESSKGNWDHHYTRWQQSSQNMANLLKTDAKRFWGHFKPFQQIIFY